MSTLSELPGRLPRSIRPTVRTTNLVLAVSLIGIAVLAYLALTTTPEAAKVTPTTSAVSRGVVLSSVSASGTVETSQDLSVDFDTSGRISSIDVKAGKRVHKGEVLGRLDRTDAIATVGQAEASLASANASLLTATTGETAAQRKADAVSVSQSRSAVQQAHAAVDSARNQLAVDEVSTRQNVASAGSRLTIRQQEAQLRADQGNERAAVVKLQTDKAKLNVNGTTYESAELAVSAWTAIVNQDKQTKQAADQTNYDLQLQQTQHNQQLNAAQTELGRQTTSYGKEYWQDQVDDAQSQVNSDALKIQQQSKLIGQIQYQLSQDESQLATLQTLQSTISQDQASVISYEAKIVSDRNQIASSESSRTSLIKSAVQTRDSTRAKDRQSIATAQQQLASAKLTLKSTQASVKVKQAVSPATVAQARASVIQAAANLASANRTLAQTVLRAPADGTIASVNGVVGQSVSGSGTTVTASSSSSTTGTSTSTASSGSSSSSFVDLVDLSGLQVSASFSESDAAKIRLGQAGTVTVSALPNKELAAHVMAIDVTGATSSSVVQYTVTLALDRTVAGLKPGMSANATVTTGERDNVLNVPNAAVTGTGANATVKVISNSIQRTVNVVAGLKGDSTTEIQSGLRVGQRVVTSSGVSLTTGGAATGGQRAPGGGIGGGFGGPPGG
jgi:multidrug efflux pump subunit AcrA (membrane-fusion protein)